MNAVPDTTFKPSERFSVLRLLGAGGMGVVYEAFDNERQVRVALKTLSRLDPEFLYLFKQEFRALADIIHPSLAKLYELISEGGQWYFTMEFVEGQNLLQFAWEEPRNAAPKIALQPGADSAIPTVSLNTVSVKGSVRRAPTGYVAPTIHTERRASFEGIRGVLRQLVEGINFLHSAGKLHRDIKPSNIMVTPEGRVVLLDFGLVSELRHDWSKPDLISGTVAYMPPEQAVGARLTEAADWYAVGCTLYEVLTGRLPFYGEYAAVIHAKQTSDPPSPGSLVAGIPEDLAQLCMDLLQRDPEARPKGAEILQRVGGQPVSSAEPGVHHLGQTVLVGRERHLDELRRSFSAAEAGKQVLTFVHGPSGFGKTALIEAFLDELSYGKRALVLRGRCFEQESVPYKGFDSLVDSLVRHLQTLTGGERENLLPHNSDALAQLFPVTQRVALAGAAARPIARQPDRLELRRTAFDALRELIQRLASRQPLVLFIDDLHWGDLDSAFLLSEILRPAAGLPLLIVCSYRSEYAQTSQCLQAISEARFDPSVERRELVVGPLDPPESERLALSVLTGDTLRRQRAQAIALEAKGSPFFVLELATYIYEEQANGTAAALSGSAPSEFGLDQVLWNRVSRLPAPARSLLEVLAVSGQPLRRVDATQVVAQGVDDPSVMAVLRASRLVRSAGLTQEDEIETYHDRIREAIVTRLSPATRRDHHRNLARTLEKAGGIDPERLAVHFHGGGELGKAGKYYRLGADRASQALAFDRACGLYQKALDLVTDGDGSRHQLSVQLADALANAGRGPQAAQQYLAACATAAPDAILPLKQKAAYHFCASGHVDQGKEAFRQVLAAVNTALPKSPRAAVASILWHKLRLQLRGKHFRERPSSAISPSKFSRLNAFSSAATGLGMVDLVAGADFASRFLSLALEVGEPSYAARALSWHAWHASGPGPLAEAKTMPLLALARSVAGQSGDPLALAWSRLAAGVAYLQFCKWRVSNQTLEDTLLFLRKDCRDVAWEIATASTCQLLALNGLGEYAEMGAKCPPLLQDAMDRGDMYAATNIGTWVLPPVRLAADDPAGARESIREYASRWSQQGFHLQHLWALISEAYVDLYQGEGDEAVRRLDQRWRAAEGSLLFRIYLPRTFSYHVRARACLQAAERAADPEPLLTRVVRDCRTLEQERTPFTSAAVLLLQAGVANVRRDHEAAVALLRRTEEAFISADMNAYVAAARFWLASLLGGDEGRELHRRSAEWMDQQRICNPERMAALHAPGFRL
jgi:serine/threonine protein kinase